MVDAGKLAVRWMKYPQSLAKTFREFVGRIERLSVSDAPRHWYLEAENLLAISPDSPTAEWATVREFAYALDCYQWYSSDPMVPEGLLNEIIHELTTNAKSPSSITAKKLEQIQQIAQRLEDRVASLVNIKMDLDAPPALLDKARTFRTELYAAGNTEHSRRGQTTFTEEESDAFEYYLESRLSSFDFDVDFYPETNVTPEVFSMQQHVYNFQQLVESSPVSMFPIDSPEFRASKLACIPDHTIAILEVDAGLAPGGALRLPLHGLIVRAALRREREWIARCNEEYDKLLKNELSQHRNTKLHAKAVPTTPSITIQSDFSADASIQNHKDVKTGGIDATKDVTRRTTNVQKQFATALDAVPKAYTHQGLVCGPLEGNATALSRAISNNKKAKPNYLKAHHNGKIFVRQLTPKSFEVYFRTLKEFHDAKLRLTDSNFQ